MKKIFPINLLLLGLFLMGCASNEPLKNPAENNSTDTQAELLSWETALQYKNEKYGFELQLPPEFKDYYEDDNTAGIVTFALQQPEGTESNLKSPIPWLLDSYYDVIEIHCDSNDENSKKNLNKIEEADKKTFLWKNNHYSCSLFIPPWAEQLEPFVSASDNISEKLINGFSMKDL